MKCRRGQGAKDGVAGGVSLPAACFWSQPAAAKTLAHKSAAVSAQKVRARGRFSAARGDGVGF